MALVMYVDESEDEDAHFVLAGYLAPADAWGSFIEDWQDVLRESPAQEAFHMVECRQQGADWKLLKLISIIQQYARAGVCVAVRKDDFDAEVRGKISKGLDTPYRFLFYRVLTATLAFQKTFGINEPVSYIFDEKFHESDIVSSGYADFYNALPEEAQKMIDGRPIHRSDVQAVPLQAADILAWWARRVLAFAQDEKDFVAANKYLFDGKVPIIMIYHNRERLAKEVSDMRSAASRRGHVTDHDMLNIRKDLAIHLSNHNRAIMSAANPGETVDLLAIPATQMKRYRLVRRCPLVRIPHLHKRREDECQGAQFPSVMES